MQKAYDDSWFTILGAGGDINEWKKGIQDLLDENNIGKIQEWAVFTGKELNKELRLTGNNAYPDNLIILCFSIDGLNTDKLATFRVRFEGHWFDDVAENDAARQDEINASSTDDYSSFDEDIDKSYVIEYPDGSKKDLTLDNMLDAPYDTNTLTGDFSSISLGNYDYYYKIGKDRWLYADHNPHVLGGQFSSRRVYDMLVGNKTESKSKKLEAQEADDSLVLSPDMSAVYTSKNSVPIRLQLLRKAIAEETKSIHDYEEFINSGNFAPDEITVIQEIANDEKDHIVKWTRMLSKMTEKEYSQFGNESVQPKTTKPMKVESKSNKNKIKFF